MKYFVKVVVSDYESPEVKYGVVDTENFEDYLKEYVSRKTKDKWYEFPPIDMLEVGQTTFKLADEGYLNGLFGEFKVCHKNEFKVLEKFFGVL